MASFSGVLFACMLILAWSTCTTKGSSLYSQSQKSGLTQWKQNIDSYIASERSVPVERSVTKPVIFHVETSAYRMTLGNNQLVPLNHQILNIGDAVKNSVFTAPQTGTYRLSFAAKVEHSFSRGGFCKVYVNGYLNDGKIAQLLFLEKSSTFATLTDFISFHRCIELKKGDTITFKGEKDPGADVVLTFYEVKFSGWLEM